MQTLQVSTHSRRYQPKVTPPKKTHPNRTFKIELARTPEEQQKGLSNRASLPEDHGMLFLFDKPAPYGFWMKEMRFPLDIIFIKNKTVVTVDENLPAPVSGT
jgi:uncharacterized membrane protein (UPF0127 family)